MRSSSAKKKTSFYLLAGFFALFVLFLYGPMLSIFILSEFMKQGSDDLKNAGRIDGLSEYTIFFRLVLPLVRLGKADASATRSCLSPNTRSRESTTPSAALRAMRQASSPGSHARQTSGRTA